MCRTTHDKTHNDLIRCTKIPSNTEICFIDDMFHPKMANDNIYYINLKPYYYDLVFDDMISIFLKSTLGNKIIEKDDLNNFKDYMETEIDKYNYDCVKKTEEEYDIDKILGKHVLTHLQTFFNDNKTPNTRKNYINKQNKTKRTRKRKY